MSFIGFMCFFPNRRSENKPPEMTMERAVNLLSQDDEETLICAASYIQNQCFRSADAKKTVGTHSKQNLPAVKTVTLL